MRYIEATIYTDNKGSEDVIARLLKHGIDQFTVEDPLEIHNIENKEFGYEWDYIDEKAYPKTDDYKVIIYFNDDSEGERQLKEIKEEIDNRIEVKLVNDDDWLDTWKEFFKPAKITDKIVIKPTWEDYEAADDEVVIEIDPGRAFGTGTHETTSGCLALIEKYMKAGDNLLDVGCGSGILSIGAALLGAKDVLAIDIDPVAVEVTDENAAINGCSSVIRAEVGDLTKGVSYRADIVSANLMADLVMMLTKDVAKHLKDGGIYISSGILLEKEKIVSDVLTENGFEIIDVFRKGEWCAIAARLK